MSTTRNNGRRPLRSRKDLHDGRTLWHDTPHRHVRTRAIRGDEHFEIVVVGAGITGAITSLVLSAAGHEVAVVDRRPPGEGSTIASTAMIQFEIDTPLIRLAEKIGRPKAQRAYRRSADAVGALRDLITTHDLTAHWVDRDALYLAGETLGFRAMKDEATARRAIGLPSQFLGAREVADQFGIEATGAILSSGSAELNPARTSAEALRAAKRLGATIIAPCEIASVEAQGAGLLLRCAGGTTITARKAIFTLGYEAISGLPRDAFEIVSSWAIATKPIAADRFWPGRCLIWEAADPYLYLRSTRDNRIIAGGEDSKLTAPERRAAATPAKAETLIRKVRRLLDRPDLEVDYAWGGAFAESPTGLPLFKPLDGLPGAYGILGCGGNGITFAMIAAEVVASWIRGKRDRDADLFTGR